MSMYSPVMVIRLAKIEDLSHVARLRWDFKIEDGDSAKVTQKKFEQLCFDKLRAESGQWSHFLAFENDEPVGMVSICRVPKLLSPDLKSDSIGYLTNTYVVPHRRNKGVGEELLETAVAWAKDANLELLFVWPSDRSRSFYGRLGFEENRAIMELLF